MSAFDLTDRVAIVTGGGGTEHGVGSAIAIALADAGASIVVAGRDTGHLEPVSTALQQKGARSLAVPCDVTDPDQCANLIATTTKEFGRLDILVNNAASTQKGDPLELTPEQWRESIDVNLNGVFFCCQAAARHMVAKGSGHIVNIASSSGIKGDEFMAPYAAAKAAVINLTKRLAARLVKDDILVTGIAPGAFASEMNKAARDLGDIVGQHVPAGRIGNDEDMAGVAIYLASRAGNYVVGETIAVDGGVVHAFLTESWEVDPSGGH